MPNYPRPHMPMIVFGGIALLLAACQHSAQVDSKMRSNKGDTCRALHLRSFVGMQMSASTFDAMHRRLGIDPNREEVAPHDPSFRTIKPGDEIIANYEPRRINISESEDGKILNIWCG